MAPETLCRLRELRAVLEWLKRGLPVQGADGGPSERRVAGFAFTLLEVRDLRASFWRIGINQLS